MSKSTAQQIADLQNKLQALRTKKSKTGPKGRNETKIILGAEVAKVLGKNQRKLTRL